LHLGHGDTKLIREISGRKFTMNRVVNLTKRVKTAQGLRYCPVVYAANQRVKRDVVIVNDSIEEKHPEGGYYLDWTEGTKRVRLSVGKDPQEAEQKRKDKEALLNAKGRGINVAPETERRLLSVAIADYLDETKLTKKPKTLSAYTTALEYFAESCHKLHVDDIERRDMLKFHAFLRDEKEQAPRSCWNKFSNVMAFLKANGVSKLVRKGDWPVFTEEEPEVYEQDELDLLFKACDVEELIWFQFFLMTGMREQEVMHSYWRDVNFADAVVRVTHKPDRGWTPKTYKERTIPIPSKLVNRLKEWKKKADKKCELVFPTSGCKPKMNFLDDLRAVAERAELDPDRFWLHKFRATFATWHLWKGVDLRTVQSWMGHTDLESTMRYLKPAHNQAVQQKVNETFS
jgi:integrase/recombinase XerD